MGGSIKVGGRNIIKFSIIGINKQEEKKNKNKRTENYEQKKKVLEKYNRNKSNDERKKNYFHKITYNYAKQL